MQDSKSSISSSHNLPHSHFKVSLAFNLALIHCPNFTSLYNYCIARSCALSIQVLHVLSILDFSNISPSVAFRFGSAYIIPTVSVQWQFQSVLHSDIPVLLTLKGQCKPRGLGIIWEESCSKLLLHCTKWDFQNAKSSTLERSILLQNRANVN